MKRKRQSKESVERAITRNLIERPESGRWRVQDDMTGKWLYIPYEGADDVAEGIRLVEDEGKASVFTGEEAMQAMRMMEMDFMNPRYRGWRLRGVPEEYQGVGEEISMRLRGCQIGF